MELVVYKIDGQDSGKKVKLNPDIFGIEPSEHAVYQSVRLQRANQRQGTHKTKGRSEVAGGGKKPFRQKGTGNARQGTIRAPHMVGGGRVFGPQPRLYGFKLNKKFKILARKSALSIKAQNEGIKVLEDFNFEAPKTKNVVSILKGLSVNGNKVLFVTKENDQILFKSARNMEKVSVEEARNISVYDLMDAKYVLIQESALTVINEVLAK